MRTSLYKGSVPVAATLAGTLILSACGGGATSSSSEATSSAATSTPAQSSASAAAPNTSASGGAGGSSDSDRTTIAWTKDEPDGNKYVVFQDGSWTITGPKGESTNVLADGSWSYTTASEKGQLIKEAARVDADGTFRVLKEGAVSNDPITRQLPLSLPYNPQNP